MTDKTSFEKSVIKAVHKAELSGSNITVAISGGPDSTAMLLALSRSKSETGISINGAHLDHGIRGEESKSDAEYVKTLCKSIDVDCFFGAVDVPSLSQALGISLEDAARRARNRFLLEACATQNSDAVALGHTANDQSETVLMHLIRGSGLDGLIGMKLLSTRVIEKDPPLRVFRPLLEITRTEIEEYCSAVGETPQIDSTNFSDDHTRNSVRHNLLPALENFNPRITEALNRLALSAGRDIEFIEEALYGAWTAAVDVEEGIITIDLGKLANLPESLSYRIVRRAIGIIKGNLNGITLDHIEAVINLSKGPSGNSVDLPEGVTATKGYDELLISETEYNTIPLPLLDNEYKISIPGALSIPGWKITTTRTKAPLKYPQKEETNGGRAWLHFKEKHSEDFLVIRGRKPGDRFHPKGLPGEKKLQDFMVDAHIPRMWRDRIPIVESTSGIAWVVGWRTAEWASPIAGQASIEVRFTRSHD